MTSDLTRVVQEVARDFAAQGRALPVPPNRVDPAAENALEHEFWDEVDRPMAEQGTPMPEESPAPDGSSAA